MLACCRQASAASKLRLNYWALKNRSSLQDISSTILIMLRGDASEVKEAQSFFHLTYIPRSIHRAQTNDMAWRTTASTFARLMTDLCSSGPNAATPPVTFPPNFFFCRLHSLNMSESLKTRGRRRSKPSQIPLIFVPCGRIALGTIP